MFLKYFLNNLKNHFLPYALITVLETVLLCVALTASGIVLAVSDDENSSVFWARCYSFYFSAPISYEDNCDKIYDFLNELPGCEEANIDTTRFSLIVVWYPDCDSMYKVLNERFGLEPKDLPTEEQFNNGEKVTIVSTNPNGWDEDCDDKETDDGHFMIGGEKYLITGRYSGWGKYVFFNSAPKDCSVKGLDIRFKTVPTKTELKTVYELTDQYFGDVEVEHTPQINDLLDKRFDDANILLSVVVLAMSVFNTLLVFRYIIFSQKKYFAVLRFAGFSKATSVIYSGVELLIVSVISALFSGLVFGKLLIPIMGKYYAVFSSAVFTADYYITLYGIFLGISAVMFLVYIVPSLTKSVTDELRKL